MCHLRGQLLYPCNLSLLFSVCSCSCLILGLDLSALDECRVGKTELPNYLWDQGPVREFLTYGNMVNSRITSWKAAWFGVSHTNTDLGDSNDRMGASMRVRLGEKA